MDGYTEYKISEARCRIYWFLAGFYMEKPDAKFIAGLKTILENVRSELHYTSGFAGIRDAIEEDNPHQLSQRLSVEFTRLFRGIKRGYGPPPPYESVYREGRLMGETAVRVMKFYEKAGFGIIDEEAGPQDYIGTELKFMSLLCLQESGAWEKGNRQNAFRIINLEKDFLEHHILTWVPEFCSLIRRETREKFYEGVAELTCDFLETDCEYIKRVSADKTLSTP